MKKPVRIIVTVLFLGLYLLSACTGVTARSTNRENSQGEEIVASQTLPANATETVVATMEDDNTNNDPNSNSNDVSLNEGEVVGTVEALSGSSITIDGFEYSLTSSTDFKDVVIVGDQVKAHIVINTDGTTIVTEIEKVDSLDPNSNSNDDDQIGNTNGNSNDDDQVGNTNTNGNSNDDDQIGNTNGNSNDDDQVGNSNGNSNDNSGGNSNDNEDNGGGNSNGGGGGGNSNGNDDD